MSVRAIFEAVEVENTTSPYNTIYLKIFYPAQIPDDGMGQNRGTFPVDTQRSPFPIVIFFGGINCGLEVYQWLAVQLAERGLVVVTLSWIAENIPGIVALSPGLDFSRLTPETYGSGPTALALPAILSTLERLQTQSILAGHLNLQQIILSGHSAGGRVAIESASSNFFPQVAGAFSYGSHTAAGSQMGYSPGTILPLPDTLPLLLIAGTCDGVIANSSQNYGVNFNWEQPTTPVSRTFQEAIAGGRNDSYLLVLEGANHFVITHPIDTTVGTAFIDFLASQPEEQLRNLMVEIIGLFIDTHVRHESTALTSLNQYLSANHPLITCFERK